MECLNIDKSLTFIQGGTIMDADKHEIAKANEIKEQFQKNETLLKKEDLTIDWFGSQTVLISKSAGTVTFSDMTLTYSGTREAAVWRANDWVTIRTSGNLITQNCLIKSTGTAVVIMKDGSFTQQNCILKGQKSNIIDNNLNS